MYRLCIKVRGPVLQRFHIWVGKPERPPRMAFGCFDFWQPNLILGADMPDDVVLS